MKYFLAYLLPLLLLLLSFERSNASTAEFPLNQNGTPHETKFRMQPSANPGQNQQLNTRLFEYYGPKQNEAEFVLDAKIQIKQVNQPTKEQVEPLIRKQMSYMLGVMRSRETKAAALYPKWSFSTVSVSKTAPGTYLVAYKLKSKGLFPNGVNDYTFTLPLNPKNVFKDAQGKCNKKPSEESNFWYHWEPQIEGCPLKENTHYINVNAKLNIIPNTTVTFPEYEKLIDNDKTIKITMLYGFENYGFGNWTPEGGDDWGIIGYNMQRQFLKSIGFSETKWDLPQVEKIYKAKDKYIPYVMEYRLAGTKADIRIRLVLADSGLTHNSAAFHSFLRESLAKESVVYYNGHSGLGKNLDLGQIEKLRGFKFAFNPNYQIIFLGSCVPYSYYSEIFFSRKKNSKDPNGTLRLDILSYGKEAIFGNKEDLFLTSALVSFAKSGARTSYQQIINASPNFYIGVSGDEDNPTK